jgi:hypothetical protein
VRPLRLNYGAFDDHVIDLVVMVFSLPFVLEIDIGASGYGVDCFVGGEIVALMQRLTYLWRRWQGQIELCFVLVG